MDRSKEEIPKVVTKLIAKMLDEDCTNPPGTAEDAATQLLERAAKCGREYEFKAAMKFWKNSHNIPSEVIWQWFNGVFIGAKPGAKNRSKHKPRRRRRPKD